MLAKHSLHTSHTEFSSHHIARFLSNDRNQCKFVLPILEGGAPLDRPYLWTKHRQKLLLTEHMQKPLCHQHARFSKGNEIIVAEHILGLEVVTGMDAPLSLSRTYLRRWLQHFGLTSAPMGGASSKESRWHLGKACVHLPSAFSVTNQNFRKTNRRLL